MLVINECDDDGKEGGACYNCSVLLFVDMRSKGEGDDEEGIQVFRSLYF